MNEDHKLSGHQRLFAEDLTLIAKRTVKLGPSVIKVTPMTPSPGGVSAREKWRLDLEICFIAQPAPWQWCGPHLFLSLQPAYLFPIGPSRHRLQLAALF